MTSMGEFLWSTLAVLLTLATFSFLYRDNPFYRFSEQLFVGVSAGYFAIILYSTALVPNLFDRIWMDPEVTWMQVWKGGWWSGITTGQWWYFIPGILGVMMWFRFSKKWAWLSRYPIAFYIGIAAGIAIPAEMQNRVSRQLANTMTPPDFSVGFISGASDIIIFVGVVCALFYFFFSIPHRGAFGGVAKAGIYILMIGFGASFGFTVMGRISLFIQRVQFLRDWISAGNEGPTSFTVIMWLVILAIVLLVLFEIIRHLRKKSAEQAA